MKGMYVVVEGNIGAGKTSLATRLNADLGGHAIYEEFADNAFLSQFYQEPEKNAFPLELSFLSARYKQLEAAFKNQDSKFYIADYHFEKSLHFASVNLTSSERAIYESLFNILNLRVRKPDLVIFLQKSVEQLRVNIKLRGRPFEADISREYLQKIDDSYKKLLAKTEESRTLLIDTEHLDFVNNQNDYELIINSIETKLSAIKC